ncbi:MULTISPECIES: sugar transferase [unclassified Streptococcus]|uniref:sugar transferase n=1 Tax=unclassified Streptococcus TaxID=2608887 RepID=UPI0010726576|nr:MULTISPECIES: sugar transferase [unclassified Streptococcus]MBF0786613.1 sugar transferase [Streptococcus sp. 19428wC2_LYSM12]MCQ9212822.1 sugar transferase [Streptococcus sp. B01]MCQ9214163.1 sugar transferase [Streptococcus sp. O1]TFV06573.1 sugar transferase [Streptococcus sp. LYSM12]
MINGTLTDNAEKDVLAPYRAVLASKKVDLACKYVFDKVMAIFLIILFSPILLVFAIWIALDSPGAVFYRQERITQYGRKFKIYKFRTMVADADKKGSLVTIGNDSRITRVGAVIRKYRLDEIPQLFNVLAGDMSFVGVRPEVEKYTKEYTDEMKATLLLPAGITSPASIAYKDEDMLMETYIGRGMTADEAYVEKVLPDKMTYNLEYIRSFSFWNDIRIMLQTVIKVVK